MRVRKAVITAAAPSQRTLPLQRLVDPNGQARSVLGIIFSEAQSAGIEELCVVVCPGDEEAYRAAAGPAGNEARFISQSEPRGYGHALHCAHAFTGDQPFLHMVGDHVYVSRTDRSCASQLVEVAENHSCAISGVQSTAESLLPYFGAVGGSRLRGFEDLYVIERVAEKPTPTEAEQSLFVPGLHAGHYLCFFGMHVLTPGVMHLLAHRAAEAGERENIQLSPVLNQLAAEERYLALETRGQRYPVDAQYGLFMAQLGLALSGRDREEVLAGMCELLAQAHLQRHSYLQAESSTRRPGTTPAPTGQAPGS